MPRHDDNHPFTQELLGERGEALFKVAMFALVLVVVNVIVAMTSKSGLPLYIDFGVAAGIATSFIGAAFMARRGRLGAAALLGSYGMVVSILCGEIANGHYTVNIWYVFMAVTFAGFGLNMRALIMNYALTIVSLLLVPLALPGIPYGSESAPTLIADLCVMTTGVVFFLAMNMKATIRAQEHAARHNVQIDTQRQRAEQEATRASIANNTKSMFLANMSHELRTPLNAIIGYTALIREEAEESGFHDFDEDMEKVELAADHLLALINDVLDLSKIEAGHMEPHIEEFSARALIEELCATLAPMFLAHENDIEVNVDSAIPTLKTDRVRLRQVLLNLLANATKFTQSGQIHVWARAHRRERVMWVEFSVEDSGIGISEEKLERIFEPFVQADSSTQQRFGGTGLGLALSKRICAMLAGEIHARSVLGEGSTFTVDIPCDLDRTLS